MRCKVALVAILLLASSLVTIESAYSQTKPSVPEFTLKVVANPYDVAPTTTIEPYIGKNITTSYGYHSENKSIEITIKNQPFSSALDESGNYTNLYYSFRYKGRYSQEWSSFENVYNASKSDYTTISVNLDAYGIPEEGEVDFQVRALVGHQDRLAYDSILPIEMKYYYKFVGKTGEWSNTQTITIPKTLPSSSSLPTPNISTTSPPTQQPTLSPIFTASTPTCVLYITSSDNSTIIATISITALLAGLGVLFYFKK